MMGHCVVVGRVDDCEPVFVGRVSDCGIIGQVSYDGSLCGCRSGR